MKKYLFILFIISLIIFNIKLNAAVYYFTNVLSETSSLENPFSGRIDNKLELNIYLNTESDSTGAFSFLINYDKDYLTIDTVSVYNTNAFGNSGIIEGTNNSNALYDNTSGTLYFDIACTSFININDTILTIKFNLIKTGQTQIYFSNIIKRGEENPENFATAIGGNPLTNDTQILDSAETAYMEILFDTSVKITFPQDNYETSNLQPYIEFSFPTNQADSFLIQISDTFTFNDNIIFSNSFNSNDIKISTNNGYDTFKASIDTNIVYGNLYIRIIPGIENIFDTSNASDTVKINITLSGMIENNLTLYKRRSPYIVSLDTKTLSYPDYYGVELKNINLIIEGGVIILVDTQPQKTGAVLILNNSNIAAIGDTASENDTIILSSKRDTMYGGSGASAGDWQGLILSQNSSGTLSLLNIKYAQNAISIDTAGFFDIQNSIIQNCLLTGIKINLNDTLILKNDTFINLKKCIEVFSSTNANNRLILTDNYFSQSDTGIEIYSNIIGDFGNIYDNDSLNNGNNVFTQIQNKYIANFSSGKIKAENNYENSVLFSDTFIENKLIDKKDNDNYSVIDYFIKPKISKIDVPETSVKFTQEFLSLSFTIKSHKRGDTLLSIRIKNNGTAANSDLDYIKLYYDADTNSLYEPTIDTFICNLDFISEKEFYKNQINYNFETETGYFLVIGKFKNTVFDSETFIGQIDTNSIVLEISDTGPDSQLTNASPVYSISGNLWYVSQYGSDTNSGTADSPFLTINKALEFISAEDIIIVDTGIYTDSFTIDTDSISIIGADSNLTIIDPPGDSKSLDLTGIKVLNANNVYIQNLKIYDCYYGLKSDASVIRISNCNLSSNKNAIYIINSSNNYLIENSSIINSSIGIYIDGCDTGDIKDNILEDNLFFSLETKNSKNINIKNNNIKNNIASGMNFNNCDSVFIYNNNILNNSSYAIVIENSSSSFTVDSNFISLNNSGGISLNQVSNSFIKNNYIYSNNNKDGIILALSTLIEIENNNIEKNSKGISFSSSSSNTIKGNGFINNTLAGVYLSAGSSNKINYNNFNLNDSGIVLLSSDNNSIISNEITENTIGMIIYSNSDLNIIQANNFNNINYNVYNYSTADISRNYFSSSSYDTQDLKINSVSGNLTYLPFRITRADTNENADTIAPGKIENITYDTSAGYIKLYWAKPSRDENNADLGTSSEDLYGYRIYRSAHSDTLDWEKYFLAQITDVDDTFYFDTNIILGETYYYRIIAFDSHYTNSKVFNNYSQYSDTVEIFIKGLDYSGPQWYVSDSTGTDNIFFANGSSAFPFKTISFTLQFTKEYDTVYVAAGEYSETIYIDTDYLSIIADDTQNCILNINDSTASNNIAITIQNCSGVLIKNFIITNYYDAIKLNNTQNCFFENLTIYSNNQNAVFMNNSAENIVQNNLIYNNLNAVYLVSSDNNKIKYNNITNNNYGIKADNSDTNIFIQNLINKNTGYNIVLDNSSKDNIFNKNNILSSSNDSGVVNNTVNDFDFNRNYWGTSDSEIINYLCKNNFSGKIIYYPFRLDIIDTQINADTVAPSAPDISIDTSRTGKLILWWDIPTSSEEKEAGINLAGFNLYRFTSDTESNIKSNLYKTFSNTDTNFIDTNIVSGNFYYYVITSFDNADKENESFYSNIVSGTGSIKGDFNYDSIINFFDLTILARYYGYTADKYPLTLLDLNEDGKIDIEDYKEFLVLLEK